MNAPVWLPVVQRRITDSIMPPGASPDDERYCSAPIAAAALEVLDRAGDIMPGEPYLDRLDNGALVLEWQRVRTFGPWRRVRILTIIVDSALLIVYGAARGVRRTHRLTHTGDIRAAVADTMRQITPTWRRRFRP